MREKRCPVMFIMGIINIKYNVKFLTLVYTCVTYLYKCVLAGYSQALERSMATLYIRYSMDIFLVSRLLYHDNV